MNRVCDSRTDRKTNMRSAKWTTKMVPNSGWPDQVCGHSAARRIFMRSHNAPQKSASEIFHAESTTDVRLAKWLCDPIIDRKMTSKIGFIPVAV